MDIEKLKAQYQGRMEAYQHALITLDLYLGSDLSWGVVQSCLRDTLDEIMKARDAEESRSPRWHKLESMRKTYVSILASWHKRKDER